MSDPIHKYLAEMLKDQRLRERLEPKFDHEDDALMHDIMGNENLAKPVQSLLNLLQEYEMTKKSFGADDQQAMAFIVPLLKNLREACIREFNKL